MIDLTKLRISLTKNGMFKVAELLKVHSRWQILDNVDGKYEGIDLVQSQIANLMDINPLTGDVPEFWDAIREHGHQAIDAFFLTTMLFSHEKLIRLFQAGGEDRDEFTGYFLRRDLANKVYTNLAFSLGCFGVSDYRRNAGIVKYDLTPVIYHLQYVGQLIQEMLRSKLLRTGWIDPSRNPASSDRQFLAELKVQKFNRVMSMEWPRFEDWLLGRLMLPRPVSRFGLREVGLFTTPIPLPQAGD
jgi:hypothetical protein